jgi:sulfur carrier protein
MIIYLNDKPLSLEHPCSLAEMLFANNAVAQHIAVAINNQFIPKPLFASTQLHEGDRIDLIVPMQGG